MTASQDQAAATRAAVAAEDAYVTAVRYGRHPDARRVGAMAEADLDAEVVKLCKRLRLVTFHTRDSRRSDGAGFPDRVIVGLGGVMWRELKSEWSSLRPAQTRWKYDLLASGQDWGLWRPSDLLSGRIARELEQLTRRLPATGTDRDFFAAMAAPEPSEPS